MTSQYIITTLGKSLTDTLAIGDEVLIYWDPSIANTVAEGRDEDYSHPDVNVEADLSKLGLGTNELLTWNSSLSRFEFIGVVDVFNPGPGNPYLIAFNATDDQGNVTFSADKTVNADLVRPTVSTVAFNTNLVNEALVPTPDSVTLTITFSENMDTSSSSPTVTLSGAGATATLVNGAGVWANPTTYVVTYDVVDDNVELAGNRRCGKRCKDAAKNVQTAYSATNTTTRIDTKAPEVVSIERVSASPTLAAAVDFTVTFDSPIDCLPSRMGTSHWQ